MSTSQDRRLPARYVSRGRRAFSLIELLVVILIIALIVAIVLPALGGARSSARLADTQSLASQASQAIGSFQIDNKRLPGKYSVREMADPVNLNRGMSMAENVMLELGSMRVVDGVTPPDTDPNWVRIGPVTANALANPTLQATDGRSKEYFTPPAKYLVAQTMGDQQIGMAGHTNNGGLAQLPDLVDAFGNPFLFWIEDEASVGKPTGGIPEGGNAKTVFVRETYSQAEGGAKFYWGTNAAFLRATRLGRGGQNMNLTDNENGNFLGGANAGDDQLHALAALLGNPGFPANASANTVEIYPSASRGGYVIHSAGIDGRYLSKKTKTNRGASLAINGRLYYGGAIKNASNAAHLDGNQRAVTFDFAKEFDDVVVAGN